MKIYTSLDKDPISWLTEPTNIPNRQDQVGKLIYASADALTKLTPADGQRANLYSYAYVCGAAITLAAFKDSDLSDPEVNEILHEYPTVHRDKNYFPTIHRAEKIAHSGIQSHPELTHHVDLIERFFFERRMDATCTTFSRIGIGITAKCISDIYWDRLLEKQLHQKPSDIDWDKALKDIQ